MVEETIKTIKETEAKAEEIIKNAEAKSAEILEKAAKDAKQLKSQAVTEANTKADADMKAAIEIGERDASEALADVEAEIQKLREAAKSKEDETIASVIADLI